MVPAVPGTADSIFIFIFLSLFQYSSFDFVHNALTQTFLSVQLVSSSQVLWVAGVPTLQKLLLESIQDTQFNFDLRMQKSYLHITK